MKIKQATRVGLLTLVVIGSLAYLLNCEWSVNQSDIDSIYIPPTTQAELNDYMRTNHVSFVHRDVLKVITTTKK
jgi:hypothetical protein